MLPHEGVQIVAAGPETNAGGPATDGIAGGAAEAVVEPATDRAAASAIVPVTILTRFMDIPVSSRQVCHSKRI